MLRSEEVPSSEIKCHKPETAIYHKTKGDIFTRLSLFQHFDQRKTEYFKILTKQFILEFGYIGV